MVNDELKISVIVPVYNVERFLPRCVESILSQTYENFELLLIDDGSIDSSGELCEGYKATDERVKVYHKENGGLSDARNYGITQATGNYLMFIDSDDYVDKFCFAALVYGLSEGIDVSVCTLNVLRGMEKSSESLSVKPEFRILSRKEALDALLYDRISISACGKLYRREMFDNTQFPSGRLFEDVGTVGYVMERCNQVAVTDEAYYHYFMREESISHETMSERSFDRFFLAKGFCDYLNGKYGDRFNCASRRFLTCHALSVLRMDVLASSDCKDGIAALQKIVKRNAWSVIKDPRASTRDRIGCLSCLAGRKFYLFAWRFYSYLTNR